MSGAPPSFVFAYPEEAALAGPDALAAHVAELGFGGIAIALAYHRARRVFPRYGRISVCGSGHTAFAPERARYGALAPVCTTGADEVRAVHELREACARRGLRFHAWLVALHDERLLAALPEAAAQTADGSPAGHALCPAHPAARAYVAELVEDVCAQLAPEAVELEAAAFPAWEPAYTITLALEPVSRAAARYGAQCFCPSCRAAIAAEGEDPEQLAHATRAAASPPFAPAPTRSGAGRSGDSTTVSVIGSPLLVPPTLDVRLADVRARLLEPLIAGAAAAAHAGGAVLRPCAFGDPATVALQGFSPTALRAADGVLLGLGTRSGAALVDDFAALRPLAGELPVTASVNWAPQRTPSALAADARALRDAGAAGVALYNLTLAPEDALPAFAAAARALNPIPSEAR
ncbi:hypothetical protein [Conexibacter woesei]|uniref:Uncharacterized protein n=1 Tax=Conexibacter woesei (strain DSM 14684 / CCUG 47730 / CIP 108061 / JCM 11494 / NBRC 100937 / ID131577) TaxID=469383 RepID=D3FDC2_CONWI|nr:hypothetical protein [Conexibacter woesei]ADB53514.1 hypothetical protein Cwoe_5105 [Conexibacter woesei DSM 14684]